MDCAALKDRVAAYLDGQLGEAEQEMFEAHLACCPDCVCATDALATQTFSPLSAEARDRVCGAKGFWQDMDCALGPSLTEMAPVCSITVRWTQRRLNLPLPLVMAYAAAFGLAVVWGTRHMVRADDAVHSMERMSTEVNQEGPRSEERQIRPQVQPRPRPQPYRLVSHPPQRGTF
jgi:hypothetical protein